MFDQILVPVDRSLLAEYILPHVISIAKPHRSKIILMNVMDSMDAGATGLPTDPLDWMLQRSEAEAYLKELASRFTENGLSTETVLLEGNVPNQVIQHSNSIGSNLIMLCSHGQGGISVWNLSSVAMKIIQQARTSIMIVHPYVSQRDDPAGRLYRRILAPVDGSKRAEYGLAKAVELAKSQGAELIVAHVVIPPEMPRRVPLSAKERNLVTQVVECNRVEAINYLDKLQSSIDCTVQTRLVIADQVTEALYSLVEQEQIDLVVLNAHGIGGNPASPYGNVAANYLANQTTPLLIIQDFQRDQLIQSPAEKHAGEQQSYQDRIPEVT